MKKLVSSLVALTLLLALLPACKEAAQTPGPTAPGAPQEDSYTFSYADTIAWDAEYDVVVVGFGGAGATASIAASEAGANVLLTEKAPQGEEGGNSKVCYQIILNYTDYDDGVAYLKQECEGYDNMTDELIDFIVKGTMGNADWLESVGIQRPVTTMVAGEYPEFEGTQSVVFDFIPSTGAASGKFYWDSLHTAVVDRKDNIDVWFESPAQHLIQDPFTKTVLGVQIDRQGQTVNVRAKNGVVLACGGFENNEDMIEQFTQREACYPIGGLYNTGDGINMAIEVGADLWHMAAISGPWLTLLNDADAPDGSKQAWFNQPSMGMNLIPGGASIYVGTDGMRFIPESGIHRHGHINHSGSFYSMVVPNTMYMIFDETARLAGPLMPTFSEDNSAEIESGLIVKADTLEELAQKLGIPADGRVPNLTQPTDGITASTDITYRRSGLVYQVELYNRYCKEGYDEQFGRDPKTLTPIAKAPYYAIQVVPALVNTQGGPRRNTNCEILDTEGNVIPHLYGAGELGSMYGGAYTAGGNVAETLFSGRTAGANAAAPKSEVPAVTVSKVDSELKEFPGAFSAAEENVTLAEGETIGVGTGMGGEIKVKVTRKDGVITAVEILDHHETPSISDPAIAQIPQAIVAANSVEVDAVAGATVTSDAIKQAVTAALEK